MACGARCECSLAEQCGLVTPYQDKLCSSCSSAAGRCQCCRSKRVQALVSVPGATVNVLAALAHQQQQQQQPRSTSGTPRVGSSASSQHASPLVTARSVSSTQPTGAVPASARSNVDRSPSSSEGIHAARPVSGRSSYIASSPFHFQNATTYSLDALETDEQQQQPDETAAHIDALALRDSAVEEESTEASSTQYLTAYNPPSSLTTIVAAAAAPSVMALPKFGHVILSPSGKLLPATLDPLSPRMGARQNALGNAPQVRGPSDAAQIVASWSKSELINTLFHFYCNWQSTKLSTQLSLSRFRAFALDAGLSAGTDAASSSLSSNRLDILFTQCTRPLSGGRCKMSEEQFFEALGALALWKYSGVTSALSGKLTQSQKHPSKLVPALDTLFERNLVPLACSIVTARSGGVGLRGEQFEPVVAAMFLKYQEGLKKIFTRLVRECYADLPRADETLTHPLLEDGWKSFCKQYGFFPDLIAATTVLKIFVGVSTGLARSGNIRDLTALSFDDFIHAIFQLAQISFTLTPHALPIERIELVLHKIDSKARELGFMPIAHKVRTAHLFFTKQLMRWKSLVLLADSCFHLSLLLFSCLTVRSWCSSHRWYSSRCSWPADCARCQEPRGPQGSSRGHIGRFE